MREINTKWGPVYIEDYEFDRHKPYQREEEDRIKLFDSDKNYLDYYPADISHEEYEDIIDGIRKADELDDSLYEMEAYGSKEWLESYLKLHYKDIHIVNENGERNEFINRIGNTYILQYEN